MIPSESRFIDLEARPRYDAGRLTAVQPEVESDRSDPLPLTASILPIHYTEDVASAPVTVHGRILEDPILAEMMHRIHELERMNDFFQPPPDYSSV
jgi:hypothetical protein